MWCIEMKTRKRNFAGILAVCFSAVILVGALATGRADTGSADVPAVNEGQTVYSAQNGDEALSGTAVQSFTFTKNMPITDALRMLAMKYKKNIVPSAKITGSITITNLYDVTFEESLRAILGSNKYDVSDNFIHVYTSEEYQSDKSRLQHEVITLYYINATEAENLITPLLSDNGQIASTTAAEVDTLAGSGGNTLAIRDTIVVIDYPEKIRAIKEMIASIDVMPPQILIEVTMLEAVLDETTEFGIDFDVLGLTTSTPGTVALGDDAISVGGFASGLTAGGLSVGIVKDHVRVFIRALEKITDTTVLANPKILALNKQAGVLLIGNRDGYVTVSQIGAEGATQQVEFLESGTRLAFRPFVCKDGLIRMEINPKQSEGSIVGGLPEESTTEVTTNIMARDGETIVLGGLFKEKTVLTRSQVPLLGDLPIVGEIFRQTDDQSVRTELIVLITPHIIHEPEQADGQRRLADAERLSQRARNNITWINRSRHAEDSYKKAARAYTEGNINTAMSHLNYTLSIDRSFLDADRLKEKILSELQPNSSSRFERIMLDTIEQEDSQKWMRR